LEKAEAETQERR